MPTNRLITTVRLPTDPLPDCILLFYYPNTHYQSVYYCLAPHRPAHYQSVYYCLAPHRPAHYHTVNYCLANHRSITRLYTTVLLPIAPLPDSILLFCYLQAHFQTAYYCPANHRPTTRLYTSVPQPTGPLPYCILLPTGQILY